METLKQIEPVPARLGRHSAFNTRWQTELRFEGAGYEEPI